MPKRSRATLKGLALAKLQRLDGAVYRGHPRVVGQFDCGRIVNWKTDCPGRIFGRMQTRCPKCTIVVKSIGAQWVIINGPCLELSGTQWNDRPEFCPILSQVVEPDVTLPGAWNRVAIQAEIDRMQHPRQ
jgi:hypothetical protein